MEYITVNGTQYECKNVLTSINAISFILEGKDISAVKDIFQEVTELMVTSESGDTYGTYSGLAFESATVYADETVKVTMHIPSETELKIAALEASQAEQDEMIAELMFGSEEEKEADAEVETTENTEGEEGTNE